MAHGQGWQGELCGAGPGPCPRRGGCQLLQVTHTGAGREGGECPAGCCPLPSCAASHPCSSFSWCPSGKGSWSRLGWKGLRSHPTAPTVQPGLGCSQGWEGSEVKAWKTMNPLFHTPAVAECGDPSQGGETTELFPCTRCFLSFQAEGKLCSDQQPGLHHQDLEHPRISHFQSKSSLDLQSRAPPCQGD